MKNLLLNSILLFLTSCTFANYSDLYIVGERPLKKNEIKSFLEYCNVVMYKTEVDIYGNYLSGILFFKKISADTIRVTFLSEFGIKFFDLEFAGDVYKKYFFIEYLNQDFVVKTIAKDLQLLMMNKLPEGNVRILRDEEKLFRIYKYSKLDLFNYVFVSRKNSEIERIETASVFFKYVTINYLDYEKEIPRQINIEHKNISLDIKLKLIESR